MSYKEKSILVTLLITVYIWGSYALDIVGLHYSEQLTIETVNALLFDAVIFTIVLEITLQVIIAIIAIIDNKDADSPADERDKLIVMSSINHAYNVLFIGVILSIIYLIKPSLSIYFFPDITLPNEYLVIHLIILFAFIAELIRLSTQLFYYRRGF